MSVKQTAAGKARIYIAVIRSSLAYAGCRDMLATSGYEHYY